MICTYQYYCLTEPIIFVFFAEYIANVFFPKGMSEFWALL
ncbi:hypothetical protein LZB63_09525, partial [Campylobacter coli]|nr:hypothetical protein [Campylobacter coli]